MSKILLLTLIFILLVWVLVVYSSQRRSAKAERALPPLGEIVTIGTQRVHAIVSGSGPDLVLIHGASGNVRDFKLSLIAELSKDFRVIAIDRPGFGWSSAPQLDAEDIISQATAMRDAAQAFGAERPIVLGHSYGGSVALAWAVEHPTDLSALVAVSAASNTWPEDASAFHKILSTPLVGSIFAKFLSATASTKQIDSALKNVFRPQTPPENYADEFGIELSLRPSTQTLNARQRIRLKHELLALSSRYSKIEIPVSIVHGIEDHIVPITEHALPLSKQIATAELNLIEGAGHMPHHFNASEILAAVKSVHARVSEK